MAESSGRDALGDLAAAAHERARRGGRRRHRGARRGAGVRQVRPARHAGGGIRSPRRHPRTDRRRRAPARRRRRRVVDARRRGAGARRRARARGRRSSRRRHRDLDLRSSLRGRAPPRQRRSRASRRIPGTSPSARIIGWGGAWRAFLDRVRPPLTIGKERSLGRLVRTRMGDAVLERLVAPVSLGHLRDAPRRHRRRSGRPRAQHRTHPHRLAERRGGRPARRPHLTAPLSRRSTAGCCAWCRRPSPGSSSWAPTSASAHRSIRSTGSTTSDGPSALGSAEAAPVDPADHVIIATPEAPARALLGPLAPALPPTAHPAEPLDVVTLVVRAPALDCGTARRRGLPGRRHLSRRRPHPLHRAVAVARGDRRAGGSRAARGLRRGRLAGGDAGAGRRRSDGTRPRGGIRSAGDAAHRRARGWRGCDSQPAAPASALGHQAATEAARAAIGAVGGLSAVGGWLAGSGLAQVVPDAVATADDARRHALWGDDVGLTSPTTEVDVSRADAGIGMRD